MNFIQIIIQIRDEVNTMKVKNLNDSIITIVMHVEMVTRRIRQDGDERGMIVYGYKFRPVLR